MDMPFLMNLPISARLRAKVEAQGKGRGQAAPMAACIRGTGLLHRMAASLCNRNEGLLNSI
jgi:hypothetical protein